MNRSLCPLCRRTSTPLRAGIDQGGGNKFAGELGRISVFAKALSDAEIQALAQLSAEKPVAPAAGLLFSGNAVPPGALKDSAAWDFAPGLTVEAWVKPEPSPTPLPAAGGGGFNNIPGLNA